MQLRILLAGLAAVALAAGCGGGGDGGGDRLSTEEYIQQADAICADADEQIAALGEPESLADVATIGAEAVSIAEQSLDELRALSPPEAIEEQVNRALDLLGQQNELGRELVAAAESGDQAQAEQVVAKIEPIDAEADQIAQDIGLTECGSGD